LIDVNGVDRAAMGHWFTEVPAPAARLTNVYSCEQHPCQLNRQHAHDAAEACDSHLAEGSARSSFPRCRGHVTAHWC